MGRKIKGNFIQKQNVNGCFKNVMHTGDEVFCIGKHFYILQPIFYNR